MSSRKHDNPAPTAGELRARKMKLAEGSIIFILVLSVCVYLGVHFSHEPELATDPVTIDITAPAVPDTEPVDADPVAIATVDPEISGAVGETPPLAEILPDVPVFVTYSTAEEAYQSGRYTEAAAMFATYCSEHPDNAWGHYMRGLSLWKADRDQDAEGALREALSVKPDHLKSLVNLARVELELDRPADALETIEQALDVAPDNVDARRVLGRAYHNMGRSEDAAVAYLAALRLAADDAWTLNNLALVWIEMEQFDRALPPLARAVELAPEVAVIRNNLGTVLERTGHLSQAGEQFEVAASLGSGRGEENLARLSQVTIATDDPAADLIALAAAWTGTVVDDPADPGAAAVTAVALDTADEDIAR